MIKIILKLYKNWLYKKANVVGLGVGAKIKDRKITKEDCILVAVKKKEGIERLTKKDFIPGKIMGVKTDVVEVGDIDYMWREKHRPMKTGASACWIGLTACSAGLQLYDEDGTPYLLMNKHCVKPDMANIGDLVVNPSPADGGTKKDRIGVVTKYFFPEDYTKKDNIDYALVKLDAPMKHEDVAGNTYEHKIHNPEILEKITKGSRTIEEVRTSSPIISVDFEAKVRKEGDKIYTYPNCVLTLNVDENGDTIVEGGCSSSVGFISDKPSVQTFAGSQTVGIFNKIQNTLDDIYMRFDLELFLEPQNLEPQKHYVAIGRDWYVEPIMGKTKTTVNLNLRTEPRVHTSTYIKTIPKGTEIEILNYVKRSGGYEWVEVII